MRTFSITRLTLVLAVTAAGCVGSPDELSTTADPLTVSAPVWRADMRVQLSALKSATARTITYTLRATNGGDDDAREVVVSAHTPPGLYLRSARDLTWTGFDTCTATRFTSDPSLTSIKCTASTMAVNQVGTVTVVISNPSNLGNQMASAQVGNISPDYDPTNNFQSVVTP